MGDTWMGDMVLCEETVGLEAKKSSWGTKKNGDAKVLDSIVPCNL